MKALAWGVLASAAVACKGPPAGDSPSSTAVTAAPVPPSARPAASSRAPVASAEAVPAPRPEGTVEAGKLVNLTHESGGWIGQLERNPPARVWVSVSTKKEPLTPRGRAAHALIAELVAPGVVAPTALRAMTVAELSQASDAAAKQRLDREARVLANGTVEVTLTLAPSPALTRVELVANDEASVVRTWERLLGARETIAEKERQGLAQYQSLLAIDHVSGNAARIAVFRHDKTGRITAAEGNEAFSPMPREGALDEALARLSRHMTYSKSLDDHLAKLDRESLERALRFGDPPSLLVTPKQLEECLDRAQNIRRLIGERVKKRGADKALALP